MSCHFVILLISHFRDKYPHLPVPLHLTGSDVCKIIFSKIGGMEGDEQAYDFDQLVSSTNTLNWLAATEYKDNGLKFDKVHNKMKNVQAHLHPLREGESECNLGDYNGISTTADVVAALEEGLQLAQGMLRDLDMVPLAESSTNAWFLTPWLVKKADLESFVYVPDNTPMREEDGDGEVLRHDLELNAVDPAGLFEYFHTLPRLPSKWLPPQAIESHHVPVSALHKHLHEQVNFHKTTTVKTQKMHRYANHVLHIQTQPYGMT